MIKKLLLIPVMAAFVVVTGTTAASAHHRIEHDGGPQDGDKVIICHRSNAVNNPWQQIEVDQSAIDDGDPNDHAGHTGPIPTTEEQAQALKDAKIDWGDIIPPFEGFAGLNWTADGQAVYNNGCNYVDYVDPVDPGEPGRGGDVPVTTTSTAQAAQVDAPKAGVGAGNGAIAGIGAALTASGASIALGVRRLLKAGR